MRQVIAMDVRKALYLARAQTTRRHLKTFNYFFDRGKISSVGRALDYTLFSFYKNLFYKNIESEIFGIFRINLRAESLKRTQLNLCLKI